MRTPGHASMSGELDALELAPDRRRSIGEHRPDPGDVFDEQMPLAHQADDG
jgi:hypothetical protein